MKKARLVFIELVVMASGCTKYRQSVSEHSTSTLVKGRSRNLFLDVHNLEPGKVTVIDVAAAHKKDLATQTKFDVNFIRYWVDEEEGKVYCLSEAPDSAAVYKTHEQAHGLVPFMIGRVVDGIESMIKSKRNLFFDVHHLVAGHVRAKDMAQAHAKDLAIQEKYNVTFINSWVDEKLGAVMCLAEAPDSASMVMTHSEAHGLIPDEVHLVKEGR